MDRDVPVHCSCGAFQATARVSPRAVSHLICYCKDCRAFAEELGQVDRVLDAAGGTTIVQLEPARLHIEAGAEHLACLRLTPKGIYRWYAACCRTPLANTLGTPKFAFAGLIAANLDADESQIGPVIARVHVGSAAAPVKGYGLPRATARILWRALAARITGRWRQTPFFDPETGRAVVKPEVLSPEVQKR